MPKSSTKHNVTEVLDSEEEVERQKDKQSKPGSKDGGVSGEEPASPGGDANDEGEDEEEYEIEKIIAHELQMFQGRTGYLVKWKGYDDPKDNSWVDELDTGNAQELIDEYWKSVPKKALAQKKALDSKVKPNRGRQSLSNEGSSAKKKKPAADSDIEETSVPKKKGTGKQAASTSKTTPKTNRKSLGSIAKDSDGDDIMANGEDYMLGEGKAPRWHNMQSYMSLSSWENLVVSIDTIEQETDGRLLVYMLLTDKTRGVQDAALCRKKMPNKLLDFYEANLRWREAAESEEV